MNLTPDVTGYDLADDHTGDGIRTTIVTERYVNFVADSVHPLEQLAESIPDDWQTEYFRSEDGSPTLGTWIDVEQILEQRGDGRQCRRDDCTDTARERSSYCSTECAEHDGHTINLDPEADR